MKKDNNINHKLIRRALLLILAVLSAIGVYRIYVTVPAVKEAVTLATTVKPETFTELYFTNHLKLPSTVKLGNKYSFEFTVHNLEYKTFKYPYEVYIDTNGNRQYIEKSVFTLKQDKYITIKESFSVTDATRSAVVVNLISKNQAIDFWIEGMKK